MVFKLKIREAFISGKLEGCHKTVQIVVNNILSMKKMKLLLTGIIIMLLLNNCKEDILEDDKLTLNKTPFAGQQLKIDGYYYATFGNILRIYFFYHDGTILSGGDVAEDVLSEQEQKYINGNFFVSKKDDKLYWGIYNIDGNQIKIEKWYPSSGGGMPVYLHEGIILNDTTFSITTSIRPKTGEEKQLNEVYHFKHFLPKPYSTTRFIK